MTKISNWKIDPVTEDLLAPPGKRVREISTLVGTDAASADYVNSQIAAAIAGGVQDGANVGGASQVFKAKNGVDLEFRTLLGVGRLSAVQVADTIELTLDPLVHEFHSVAPAPTPVTTNTSWTTMASHTFVGLPAGDYALDLYAVLEHDGNNASFGLRFVVAGSPLSEIQTTHPNNPVELSHTVPRVVSGWPGGDLIVSVQGWKDGGPSAIGKEWIARLTQLA